MNDPDPTLGTLIAVIAIAAGLPATVATPGLPDAFPIRIRGLDSISRADRRHPELSESKKSENDICIDASARANQDYASGTAVLFGVASRNDTRPGDLDPKYRCRVAGRGCEEFAGGGRWIECYNTTVKGLISTNGPMVGSYLGPYPTSDEAVKTLRQAPQKVTKAELAGKYIQVSGKRVELSPRVYGALNSSHITVGNDCIVGLFQETCLVVAAPWVEQFWAIHLIDSASGVMIARFLSQNPDNAKGRSLEKGLYGF